jgi:hypothetical protein
MHGSKWVAATRIGFAARGIMYLLIGWLALSSGRTEDGGGILEYLAGGSGRILLAGMALGFLGYGSWRLADAWTDGSDRGSDAKAMAARGGGAVSGFIHLFLAFGAARLALNGRGGGGGDSTREGAATALSMPGGHIALILVAIALLGTGLIQLRKAWTLDFMREIAGHDAGDGWVCWLGRGGFAARGIVFLVMAGFFWKAGSESSSSKAGGLDEALGSLPDALQIAVAGGLLLFGLYSLVEARYRRINRPHPLR